MRSDLISKMCSQKSLWVLDTNVLHILPMCLFLCILEHHLTSSLNHSFKLFYVLISDRPFHKSNDTETSWMSWVPFPYFRPYLISIIQNYRLQDEHNISNQYFMYYNNETPIPSRRDSPLCPARSCAIYYTLTVHGFPSSGCYREWL